MKELLKRASLGEGRIVCSSDLTTLQIVCAQKEYRMYVDENALGWVLLPWDCATIRDLQREIRKKLDMEAAL